MKSKDVLDVLSGKGIVLKSQATLDASQFEVLFDALTKENQIDNIGNYLDGVTYIPSKKAATPKPEKETVKAEEKKEERKRAAKKRPSYLKEWGTRYGCVDVTSDPGRVLLYGSF